MRNLRALLVGFIALSLAVLPVAAAQMRGSMVDGVTTAAADADCCHEADHCEKQTKNDCDRSISCELKCSVISATSVAGTNVSLPSRSRPELAPVIEHVTTALNHPPLPPPRV